MLEIREKLNQDDMDFFLRLSFWALKTLRKSIFEQIMKDHPDATEEEAFEVHVKETTEYMDFSDPDVKVYIAFIDGERCGYLWMATRDSMDAWDCERPQWIYDIVVEPRFQGRGIGKALMRKGEEYARNLPSNIGLFVHSDNDSATALYRREGYVVKVTPMSKKLEEITSVISEDGMIVRELDDQPSFLRDLELNRFRKKVLFSVDADDALVLARFAEHLDRTEKTAVKSQRFAAFDEADIFLGSIWVGTSGFSDSVAMVYGLVIADTHRRLEVGRLLFRIAEDWTRGEEFSTLYVLLHSEDDLDSESLRFLGYALPGFFMEKRLK